MVTARLVSLATGIALFGAGVWIGRWSGSAEPVESRPAPPDADARAGHDEKGPRLLEGTHDIEAVLETLALDHADAALLQLRRMPPGTERNCVVHAIGSALAVEDPPLALAFAAALPGGAEHDELVRRIATGWRLTAAEGAWSALRDLPAGVNRRVFVAGLTEALWRDGAEEAARFAGGLTGAERVLVVEQVAARWSITAIDQASAWVATLEDDPMRGQLLSGLAAQWATGDSHGGETWIGSLRRDAGRDQAVNTFAQHVFAEDPARALRVASSIVDPALRASAVQSLARRWQRDDPAALRTWLKVADQARKVSLVLEAAERR